MTSPKLPFNSDAETLTKYLRSPLKSPVSGSRSWRSALQPCAAAAVLACFRRASSSCLFIGRSSRREDYQTDAAEKTAGTV
jgi:hypothetical protein